MEFSEYESSAPTLRPNKLLIPVNNFSFDDAGIAAFNEIYQHCLKCEKDGVYHQFTLTPSKGISTERENLRGAMWILSINKTMAEIVIRHTDARYYRFMIGYNKAEGKDRMHGRQAFKIYWGQLKNDGVNLNDYAITPEEGKKVKATIPSPMIDLLVAPMRTYYNVHHMDLNSAYNAGMAEEFPALRPTIERMYYQRKEKPVYKDILNMTQGFLQSELVQYRFSHISKAGHVFTHRKVEEMAERLRTSGRRILSFNTDGIWYQGEIYEDDSFGTGLGMWKTDERDCKIRFKSKGAYEYVNGEGQYRARIRGTLNIEKYKPRESWTWEDNVLESGDGLGYTFIFGEGFVKHVIDKI